MRLITSFNDELYKASGNTLLKSFLQTKKFNDKLFVAYEGKKPEIRDKDIIYKTLNKNKFLSQFLEEHKEIIPSYLGGIARHCDCKDWEKRHSKYHIKGCHYHWMNRNLFRWLKKLVAIDLFLNDNLKGKSFIWLDSDCIIKKRLNISILFYLFNSKDIFYFKGKRREAIETGIIGFSETPNAIKIFNEWLDKYKTGDFLLSHRWDDSYQFTLVCKKYKKDCNDVAEKIKSFNNDIIPRTPMSQYIDHNKGLHGRILGIVK